MTNAALRKEAEALVEQAIEKFREAEEWDPGIVAGWVLAIDIRGADVDEDGDSASGVGWVYSNGSMPWVQAIGIVRALQVKMEHNYLDKDAP